jgi:hypothetical protein
MKEDLVVERIRLWTNTFIEIRQRWLTGEIYYRAYGHLNPELQGGISHEDYLRLRNGVIEKDVDEKPVYKGGF